MRMETGPISKIHRNRSFGGNKTKLTQVILLHIYNKILNFRTLAMHGVSSTAAAPSALRSSLQSSMRVGTASNLTHDIKIAVQQKILK